MHLTCFLSQRFAQRSLRVDQRRREEDLIAELTLSPLANMLSENPKAGEIRAARRRIFDSCERPLRPKPPREAMESHFPGHGGPLLCLAPPYDFEWVAFT